MKNEIIGTLLMLPALLVVGLHMQDLPKEAILEFCFSLLALVFFLLGLDFLIKGNRE